MGFRLQRSIKLGKNVRLNISKSGLGVSAKVAGVTVGAGPRGNYVHVNLPGTGFTYRKYFGGKKSQRSEPEKTEPRAQSTGQTLPEPGLFAPRHEKELVRGVEKYRAGQPEAALDHFLDAAADEPGAAIFAAALLAEEDLKNYRAVELLEGVIFSDETFPTALREKYLADSTVYVEVTPHITATVPVDGLAATLLLVELYQAQRRVREAIALLEEVQALTHYPILALSLCELYASREMWPDIIDLAKEIEPEDDVTLEISIYYGRAMQAQNLHEAAITVFTQALRRKKDRSTDLLNEALYWRAISYQAQGRADRANKEFQKIYAADPEFKDVAQRLHAYEP